MTPEDVLALEPNVLSQTQREFYFANGYLLLEKVLSDEWIERLRRATHEKIEQLIPGLIWGLVTALLPWLVLFPGFGWGAFGIRSPRNMRPVLSLSIEHSIYGLGLGMVLTITSQLWEVG